MTRLRLAALAALLAVSSASAEEDTSSTFCSFEKTFPDWEIEVSGGSKSYTINVYLRMYVVDGIKVDFRSLDPNWGFDVFDRYGDLKLSLFNDGNVYFRSDYPVSQGEPRVGVDQYLESQGKRLILVLSHGEPVSHVPLAGVTRQISGNLINAFAIAKPEQTGPLFSDLDGKTPFQIRLATDNAVIAETAELNIVGYDEAKAYGDEQFRKMQADAAAGICM